MAVQRRLAGILAADVAGYSRMTGLDEEGTLARLGAIRNEVIDPGIVEYRGRLVKTTGDGILAEFGSVVDAARCILDVQRKMSARNLGLPTDRRIEFRAGAAGRQMAAGIPGARFVVLQGHNHIFLEHEPARDRFFEEIALFLKN